MIYTGKGAVRLDWFQRVFPDFWDTFTIEYLLSPVYLLGTALIVLAVCMLSKEEQSFLSFLFPKKVYLHKSTWLDIKLAAFNTFFLATGAIAALVILPWVTIEVHHWLVELTGYDAAQQTTWRTILAGVIIFLTKDFCR